MLLTLVLLSGFGNATGAAATPPTHVSILWSDTGSAGTVEVDRGEFSPSTGSQHPVPRQTFDASGSAEGRLELSIVGAENRGALPTLVTVRPSGRAFTFRLQDVDTAYPIFLPADGVIVTTKLTRVYLRRSSGAFVSAKAAPNSSRSSWRRKQVLPRVPPSTVPPRCKPGWV